MNDRDRRRYEMLQRVNQFGLDNTTDFAPASVGALQFAVITARLAEADTKGAAQQAGFSQSKSTFDSKATIRGDLLEDMGDISRTARSMEAAFDGIADLFRMPSNRTDQNVLASARAFFTNSEEHETDFIAYGMSASFRDDLNTTADNFETSFGPTGTATDAHVAATAEIAEAIRLGTAAVQILDGVVRNKYASNTGKLAAWVSASHVEKAPKKPKPPTP
ncbi:MAG: hypothetical protein ABI878_01450 [Acidobacteriota bacterium]